MAPSSISGRTLRVVLRRGSGSAGLAEADARTRALRARARAEVRVVRGWDRLSTSAVAIDDPRTSRPVPAFCAPAWRLGRQAESSPA
jgi:hypothetical protein